MKTWKRVAVGTMAAVMLFGGVLSTPINASTSVGGWTTWNNGTFAWNLNNQSVTIPVRPTNVASLQTNWNRHNSSATVRLIVIGELRTNATGALIGSRHIRDLPNANVVSLSISNFTSGRIVFGTHEARATTSIARFTSLLR